MRDGFITKHNAEFVKCSIEALIMHEIFHDDLPDFDKINQTYKRETDKQCTEYSVFTQLFSDSAGIFSEQENHPENSIVEHWIVVVGDGRTYGVFSGNQIAYIVDDPNEKFFEDVKKKQMRTIGEVNAYGDEI